MRSSLLRALSLLPGSRGRRAAYVDARARLEAGQDVARVDHLVAALLAEAESCLQGGDDAAASEALTKALTLHFHPARRPAAQSPDLIEHPRRTLDLLGTGLIGEVLGSRGDLARPRTDGADRPDSVPAPRILVLAGGGLTFLEPVIAAWRAAGSEVSTVRVADLPAAQRPTLRTVVGGAVSTWRTGSPAPVPEELATRLDGVDHVHVEWGDEVAAWISHLDLGDRTLSVRIHRYEILTPYPHLIAADRVDTLCFVAPHVRDTATEIAPHLTAARRIDVTPNALDLDRFAQTEPAGDLPTDLPGPDHVLAMVGWAGPVKDAQWALDVLDEVRGQDDGPWTLLLVGPAPVPQGADAARAQQLLDRIAEAGDRVRVVGRRDDVPAVLRHAGWLISSSLTEGTHEAVAEGAAAGCVPVVRDWPQARRHGGAGTVYPSTWLVDTPAEAAQRVMETSTRRDQEGAEARERIRADRDPADLAAAYTAWTREPYDRKLRGHATPPEGGTA